MGANLKAKMLSSYESSSGDICKCVDQIKTNLQLFQTKFDLKVAEIKGEVQNLDGKIDRMGPRLRDLNEGSVM